MASLGVVAADHETSRQVVLAVPVVDELIAGRLRTGIADSSAELSAVIASAEPQVLIGLFLVVLEDVGEHGLDFLDRTILVRSEGSTQEVLPIGAGGGGGIGQIAVKLQRVGGVIDVQAGGGGVSSW